MGALTEDTGRRGRMELPTTKHYAIVCAVAVQPDGSFRSAVADCVVEKIGQEAADKLMDAMVELFVASFPSARN